MVNILKDICVFSVLQTKSTWMSGKIELLFNPVWPVLQWVQWSEVKYSMFMFPLMLFDLQCFQHFLILIFIYECLLLCKDWQFINYFGICCNIVVYILQSGRAIFINACKVSQCLIRSFSEKCPGVHCTLRQINKLLYHC